MNTLVKQLQEQLDQAQTCIRNLEAQLPNKPEASTKDTAGSNIPTMVSYEHVAYCCVESCLKKTR